MRKIDPGVAGAKRRVTSWASIKWGLGLPGDAVLCHSVVETAEVVA